MFPDIGRIGGRGAVIRQIRQNVPAIVSTNFIVRDGIPLVRNTRTVL